MNWRQYAQTERPGWFKGCKMANENEEMMASLSLEHRGLPSELMNEMFASLPLENAFGLLAKMSNGFLARNVQKMISGIKEALKENKLNIDDCGPKLVISEEGLIASHSGSNWEPNYVRTVLAIPAFNVKGLIIKPTITFYYEGQIITYKYGDGIDIGFCDQQYPLNDIPGGENSINFSNKLGIWIDTILYRFENNNGGFKKGDFVGIGIIHQPNGKMECFSTWNGHFLGKFKLHPKFTNTELFAQINLCHNGDSIRTNFGKDEWQFKEFERVLV